jgi:hypothetical protein
MKQFFFLTALIASLSLNAQITKNNWLVGGDLNFTQNNFKSIRPEGTTTAENFIIRLNTNIGYFPINKLAIGLSSRFNYNIPKGRINSLTVGAGPFVRYYFLKPENLINLFSQVDYLYGSGFTEGTRNTYNNEFNIKAGTAIFFNSSVALEVSLGYQYFNSKGTSRNPSRAELINNNLILGVGLQIHLEKL